MKNKASCYEILTNYNCNLKCLFCSQGSFDKSLNAPFERIAKEIYEAKKKNFVRIGFSGGEPTISPNIIKAVSLAKKLGFSFIRIQTNGVKFSDFNFAKKMVNAGVNFVKFSITSHKEKIHDSLVQVKGSFKKVIKGIENLRKLKIRLGNNIVINKYNYKDLKEIIRFFLKKGISNFVIIYPIYTGSMKKSALSLGVSLKDAKVYFKEAIEFMKEQNLEEEILFLNVPPCFLEGYESKSIGLENFNTLVLNPLGESLNLDENANSNKIYGKVCKKCVLKGKCLGVDKEYIKIFSWEGFKPVKKINKNIKKENEIKRKKIFFSDNEKCMLEILNKYDLISTEKLLKESKKLSLCKDCKDGNAVLNAGEKLIKEKIVSRKMIKGIYYWSLI